MHDARCTERLDNESDWKNTSTESSARPHDVILRRQFIVWLSAILIVFGLASNFLVFVIFHVFNRRRSFITISNRFVLNLAAANGFMSSAVLPFVLYSALVVENEQNENAGERKSEDSGPFSPVFCRVSALTTLSSISVSIGAAVLIAVDRFYAVNRPLHYTNHITSTKAWAMIVGSWTTSVAVSALPLLDWDRVRYHRTRYLCLPHLAGQTWLDRTAVVGVVLVYFVLPLVFMVFVYTSVSKAARRTAAQARRNSATSGMSDHVTAVDRTYHRRLSDVTASSRNLVRRRSSAGSCAALVFYKEDWKAAKTGAVMTSAFVACWMPFFADVFSDAIDDVIGCVIGTEIKDYEVFFVLLAVSSCVVNPLVYVFRTKAGRDLLLALCYSRYSRGDERYPAAALLSSAAAAAETRRLSQHGNAVGTNVNV